MTGWLMSKDTIVAEIKEQKVLPINTALLPLYFRQPDASFTGWLQLRALDTKRVNSRLLCRQLGLSDVSPSEMVMTVNAVTVTDTYWVKEDGDQLAWKDVAFRQNDLANTALLGSFTVPQNFERRTPELTNIGSFEKCWQQKGGKWWLYKVGYYDNLFSEMAAYRLCQDLAYPAVVYEFVVPQNESFIGRLKVQHGIIRSMDFTDEAAVNFEPGVCLGLRSSDSSYNYKVLSKLSPELGSKYVDLLIMDTLVANVDRHNKNFGVLRDVKTGEILSIAPNYDNNLSLLTGFPRGGKRTLDNDPLLRDWRDLAHGNLLDVTLPRLSESKVSSLLHTVREDLLKTGCAMELSEVDVGTDIIMSAYRYMEEVQEQLQRFHHPSASREPEM